MTTAAVITIGCTFLLSLIVTWALFNPFLSEEDDTTLLGRAEDELRHLLSQKELLLTQLEELEEEFRTGRRSGEEYREVKEQLMKEAAACIRTLEHFSHGIDSPARGERAS